MDVLSTAYLPGILYIRQYLQSFNPVIDLGEHYIKQTHRNRGMICSSNGPLTLTVPLRKSGSRKTGEMEISYTEPWQSQHIKAIRSCYKNSPYYEHYQPEFEAILGKQYSFLYELNSALFSWLLVELGIPAKHSTSAAYVEAGITNDYRNFDYFKSAIKPYKQVFSDRNGFCQGLSCIDLLFNKGPEAMAYIQ
jgi:hypothetical protein